MVLSRPDFDAPEAAEKPRALSVAELNRAVRGLLERAYPLVKVKGEISGFTRAASGHVYFSLKDAGAQVRCVLWKNRAALIGWRPADGDAVEVRATVTLYEGRGDFQLSVESLSRAGAGALYEAFLRLRDTLGREGLFAPERKRPLPALPRAIGVVTSLAAAALHDVLTTLGRRAPMIPVIVYPAPVQGEGARSALAAAIGLASRRAEVDVLIVCRGGGSIEDLWAFNDEAVARAIAACAMPVVSGVGHETDVTIADFAADLRAPTPTAAAELAAPAREALLADLARLGRGLARATAAQLAQARQRLDYAARGLVSPSQRLAGQRSQLAGLAWRLTAAGVATPRDARHRLEVAGARLRPPMLAGRAARVAELEARLKRAVRASRQSAGQRLAAARAALAHLDPGKVLERGYAVVRDAAGVAVRDSATLDPGAHLDITLARGGARVRVEKPH